MIVRHIWTFDGPIVEGSMSCHAAYPRNDTSFDAVPESIDCQRCHGPGKAHALPLTLSPGKDTCRSNDKHAAVRRERADVHLCPRCARDRLTGLEPDCLRQGATDGARIGDDRQLVLLLPS